MRDPSLSNPDLNENRTLTTSITKKWTNRTAAFGLGLALIGGMALVASPAQAEEIQPAAATAAPVPSEEAVAPEVEPTPEVEPAPEPSDEATPSPSPSDVPTSSPTPAPAEPELPDLAAGTVTVSGEPIVGNTLTGTTTGWPAGTTLTYQWTVGFGNYGGEVEGATSISYTLTSAEANGTMGLAVTGSLDGFTPTTVREFMETTVTQPQKPAAVAPDSAVLSQYLAAANVTVEPQTSTGLPAGALNPANAYTANITWWEMSDSYVDVYVYSQPTLVGSFAVVDGAVQIPLSAALLGSLPAGAHTLVITGQTSGLTQAVALNVAPSAVAAVRTGTALAETGASVTGPLTAAAVLLMLGAVLVLRRRRVTA